MISQIDLDEIYLNEYYFYVISLRFVNWKIGCLNIFEIITKDYKSGKKGLF
jgi:hypothetical protein